MKKLIFSLFAVAALLCACNKDETVKAPVQGDRLVKFSVSNLYSFKSTVAINDDGASQVGIYAADLSANNVPAAVSGTALNPTTPIYWGIGQTAASLFAARYPYASGAGISDGYDIPVDQTSADTFTYQDNVVIASKSASPADASVAFEFSHPFAKVVVNVTNNLDADKVASVQIKDVNYKVTKLLDLTASPVAPVYNTEDKTDITMFQVTENAKFAAVITPQVSRPTLVVTTEQGSVYNFVLAADFTFVAGKVATADITIQNSGSQGGGDHGDAAAFSFSLIDWAAADTNPSFGAGDATISNNYWHVTGCVYDDDNTVDPWTVDFPMTFKGGDKWEITINYDEAMSASDNGKGFKFHKLGADPWAVQLGMWTGGSDYMDIAYDYNLTATNNQNIRFDSAGNYTLVLEGVNLKVTKN